MATRRSKGTSKKDPLAHLESGGPRPVYLLHGEERLLRDEALAYLKEHSLPTNARDFNYDVFVGKSVDATKIADAARMLPAFAERRVVLVKDADKLNADTMNGLLAYLADPSPTTVLIFVGTKFDARTKFFKAASKAGVAAKFDHPTERQMPSIIRARAERAGLPIDDSAVRALVAAIGTDVGAVAAAIEKLLLWVGPDSPKRITGSDVATVVSHIREDAIWALSDAIGSRDTAGALTVMHALMSRSRTHPLPLLGLIARHWRQLTVVRALIDQRAPQRDIASALGLPPFIAEKITRQARQQSISGLVSGLRAIADADQALKGGALPPARVMERLVLTLS